MKYNWPLGLIVAFLGSLGVISYLQGAEGIKSLIAGIILILAAIFVATRPVKN